MFCKNCGTELSESSVYCNKCGTKQNTDTFTTTHTRKLKSYKKLKQCTCLECGYSGLMGIVRPKNSFEKRVLIPLITLVIIVFITYAMKLSTVVSLIVCCITGFFIDALLGNDKKVLYCPNCEKELVER